MVAELDVAGMTQRFYTYYGTDQLYSVVTGGQSYFATTDDAGNVADLVRRIDNAVTDQFRYTPFGQLELDNPSIASSLRWKGLQLDA